jgi:hypothetical protein
MPINSTLLPEETSSYLAEFDLVLTEASAKLDDPEHPAEVYYAMKKLPSGTVDAG